jgi:hypothetical protein
MSKTPAASLTNDAFLCSCIAFDDPKHHIRLYHGDCLELLEKILENSVDLVFARLYFLLDQSPARRNRIEIGWSLG